MKTGLRVFGAVLVMSFVFMFQASVEAEQYIVKDSKPEAEIVISKTPQRTTMLAARELQRAVEKISGGNLPIVREPSGDVSVTIYVGESPNTKTLGITDEGLDYGGYRIVSGKDWLALLGNDDNWTPVSELSNRDYKVLATGRITTPEELADPDFDKQVDIWMLDERGSFNAVVGFLRKLGMRWYMPGEIGEITPELTGIALPKIDETVHPAIPKRRDMNAIKWGNSRDITMWVIRLGAREESGYGAHGICALTDDEEFQKAHPDYYAKYGNKDRQPPHACYSSPGFFKATVDFVRKRLDETNLRTVSIMPADGYTSMCQCERCKGEDTPERGSQGRTSDHIWGFVNRVAEEIAKTHPDKTVNNLAYGSYWLPPLKIEKFHPNVEIGIVSGRRPKEDKPAEQKKIRENREAWIKKTDNKIFVFENYPMGSNYLPFYTPHIIADTINQTKGHSMGEDIWTYPFYGPNGEPGYFHFPVYFTMRMYWGDKNQDVDPMLEEYYRLFYGPAEKEMRNFFEYCEKNWREAGKEREKADKVLELIKIAKDKVEAETVYGKRIALVDRFLNRLRGKLDKIGVRAKRINVPELNLAQAEGKVNIDGKLDEEMWKKIPENSGGEFKELKTGEKPKYGTTFKAAWGNDGIYIGIRCEEDPNAEIAVTAKTHDDPAVYYGDNVEFLLETPEHSYYQMTINPAGAMIDLDRSRGIFYNWDSQAVIATDVGKGYWTVEMFLPVFESAIDPNHQVVAKERPSKDNPWYFNLCRQRIREKKSELSAYSPTMAPGFHVLEKFARMVGAE